MNLQRFLDAQAPVYDQALNELKAGYKQSHWIWFVFPQHRGLGCSQRAQFYGIECLDEARAFQKHPVLGPRLHECTTAVLRHTQKSASQILGAPDDLKFFSCMTLFSEAAPEELVFRLALQAFFNGAKDPETLRLCELTSRKPLVTRAAPGGHQHSLSAVSELHMR
ncbi:DUF1810 domain-containing protein [Hydrogenophaga sp.]|uniref:DUF1810 domain-containing protein n=1 Tax=Hydrogenophaga sp. TaxID=1904254 RepID=UPI003AF779B1